MRNSDRPKPARPNDPASKRFALARDLIQRNRRQASLGVLDSQLKADSGAKTSARRQAKVAALIGDYEKKRGHFSTAAEYYSAAAAKLDAKETREWFRPTLGCIRALIAQPAVDEAFTMAQNAWIRAKASAMEFDAATNISINTLQEKGRIEIGPRPLRPSVVASRLGEAFLQAGEWEMAEFFFHEALLINPNGGCRARQALAKIALAANRFDEAEARAQEALLLGRYRAKTLSAWPLLIDARARQKKLLITERDKAGLHTINASSVRARAVLVICKALRPLDDSWMDLAAEWIGNEGESHPAIRFELEKLIRQEARLAGVINRDQAAMALRHARTKGASPTEAISAGKAYVRTALLAGAQNVQWDLVSRHLKREYGDSVAFRAVHSMALGAMDANRNDLARPMLSSIRQSLPATRLQWMKSTWALAQMEESMLNYQASYTAYSELAQNKNVPSRFRIQSLLYALNSAKECGLKGSDIDAGWIKDIIDQEKDHRALLDMGRQLSLAGDRFKELTSQAANRGTSLAMDKLKEARHPSVALSLLLELNRRQFYDFKREAEVVQLFETYASVRMDWLWSANSSFWQWYSVVMHSVAHVRGWKNGVATSERYLFDKGTPREGFAILAVETGCMLVNYRQHPEAKVIFDQAITAGPEARHMGAAYYWRSVMLLAQGKANEAKIEAECVRRCYKFKPGLADEWSFDAQAALILKNKSIEQTLSELGNTYSRDYMGLQLDRLNAAVGAVLM